VVDYLKKGKLANLCAKLECKKRNLKYCKAAYLFCSQFPLMLFCRKSWSAIRSELSTLELYIDKNTTSAQWQLPEGCPNAQLVARLLGN
jgi:hypothetical protein